MKRVILFLLVGLVACASAPPQPFLLRTADAAAREAVAAGARQQWVEAEAAWREALATYQAIDDWTGQGRARLGLASALMRVSKSAEAADVLRVMVDKPVFLSTQRAQAAYQLALIESSMDWLAQARLLCGSRCWLTAQFDNFEAGQAARAGQWNRVAELAQRALKAADDWPAEQSHAQRLLAEVAIQSQDWLRAQQALEAALRLDRMLAEPCWLLDDYTALARLAGLRGDAALAQEAKNREQSIRIGLGSKSCLAVAGSLR